VAAPTGVPLNVTVLAPWLVPKPLPVIVSELPTGPAVGSSWLISGMTVKLLALDPVPPDGVVTLIGPVCPDAGTVA
jgi:hypothetical protein